MKKSNRIILAIALLVSIFLLWLWYYLGFNRVDNPLDLVLSVVWWALVALIAFLVTRCEKRRRMQIRTIYVAPGKLFNSETGVVEYGAPEEGILMMQNVLGGLEYRFDRHEAPAATDFDLQYIVHSLRYETENDKKQPIQAASATTVQEPTVTEWEGDVIKIVKGADDIRTTFRNKDELVGFFTGATQPPVGE